MKRFWLFGLLMMLSTAVLTAPAVVRADEDDVNEAMGVLSGRLGKVEDTLKLKFSGDLRIRGEFFGQETDTVYNSALVKDRYRTRVRVRFGAAKKISDEVNGYLRLATGGVEVTSTNQTLTGDGLAKGIFVDQAAIEYSPNFLENKLTIIGGKMNNPLDYSSITWDADVTPEGIGVKANITADTAFKGLYFVMQENTAGSDPYLACAQLSQKFLLGDASGMFMVGGEVVPDVVHAMHTPWQSYTSKSGMVVDASANIPNTIPDMVIVEGMLTVNHKIGEEKIPVAWTLHAAYNTNSFAINATTVPIVAASPTYSGGDVSNALALLAKVGVGKPDAGAWAGSVEFGMIDPNAVYGSFSDSDSGPGYNNNTWFKGNITLGVSQDLTFGITQYLDWHTTYDVFGATYNAALGGTGRTPLFRSQIDAVVKL